MTTFSNNVSLFCLLALLFVAINYAHIYQDNDILERLRGYEQLLDEYELDRLNLKDQKFLNILADQNFEESSEINILEDVEKGTHYIQVVDNGEVTYTLNPRDWFTSSGNGADWNGEWEIVKIAEDSVTIKKFRSPRANAPLSTREFNEHFGRGTISKSEAPVYHRMARRGEHLVNAPHIHAGDASKSVIKGLCVDSGHGKDANWANLYVKAFSNQKEGKMSTRLINMITTFTYELELQGFMDHYNRKLLDVLHNDRRFDLNAAQRLQITGPGNVVNVRQKVSGKTAKHKAERRFKPDEFTTTWCIKLGADTTFFDLIRLMNFGMTDNRPRKLNYVMSHFPERGLLWRMMHTTGGPVSDSRAKHWYLNEEREGNPMLMAGEMLIYGSSLSLGMGPWSLYMDGCSGTFKPEVTPEAIGGLQSIFGFNMAPKRRQLEDVFSYYVICEPAFWGNEGMHEVIIIDKTIGEGRDPPGDPRSNCVKDWQRIMGL